MADEPPSKRFKFQDGAAYNLRSTTLPPLPPVMTAPPVAPPVEEQLPLEPAVYTVEHRKARKEATLDRITVAEGETSDYGIFLNDTQPVILPILHQEVHKQQGIKFHLNVDVCFRNSKDSEKQSSYPPQSVYCQLTTLERNYPRWPHCCPRRLKNMSTEGQDGWSIT
jgi:hypothetical protein